jgi:biotin transport system substrate-specific component
MALRVPAVTIGPASGSFAVLFGIALTGSLVIALSAKVQVPFWPVPMTLHTLAVMLIAALFGRRVACAAMAAYLLEGALGLPVFSGAPERGIGLTYLLGPTGGYLVGYFFAALIVGAAADRGWAQRPVAMGAAMFAALGVVYGLGMTWLLQFVGYSLPQAVSQGFLPLIVGDILKTVIALGVACSARRAMYR